MAHEHTSPRVFSCGPLLAVTSGPANDPRAQGRVYDPDRDLLSPLLPIGALLAHVPATTGASWTRVAEAELPGRLRDRLDAEAGRTSLAGAGAS
jgi:hypothetical protein